MCVAARGGLKAGGGQEGAAGECRERDKAERERNTERGEEKDKMERGKGEKYNEKLKRGGKGITIAIEKLEREEKGRKRGKDYNREVEKGREGVRREGKRGEKAERERRPKRKK